jgi:transposase
VNDISKDVSYETRTSALNERVDVTVRPERRRRWSTEEKLQIVREMLEAGAMPTTVARRHGISTGLPYTWRRQALAGALAGFVPVQLVADAGPAALPSPEEERTGKTSGAPTPEAPSSGGTIEVLLPNGVRVRVDAEVDSRALRRVLTALAER